MNLIKRTVQIVTEIPLILLILILLTSIGITFQYSVTSSWEPWAYGHLMRTLMFMPIVVLIGSIDIKALSRNAYFIFFISILLLIYVQFFGHTGMGAKRWINLYFIKLQPSELAKVAMVIFLSKYYSAVPENEMCLLKTHIKATIVASIPILLVAKQPDLGTALLLFFLLGFMIVICGLEKKYIIVSFILLAVSPVLIWNNLHNYQKQRVISFLNPENDPLGNGYHIIQSKIAIGSGGIKGKGFLKGTQSKLNFLPEKHTDFIFTSICEETGFIGAMSIIISFIILLISIMSLGYSCASKFNMLICLSIGFLIFEHAIINMSMVCGLIPVVGVPLPFISYGGSSLLSLNILIGLIANAAINRNSRI